ncbi:hypothetical protein IGI96_003593 [Enterococcus sp. DIV0421]
MPSNHIHTMLFKTFILCLTEYSMSFDINFGKCFGTVGISRNSLCGYELAKSNTVIEVLIFQLLFEMLALYPNS